MTRIYRCPCGNSDYGIVKPGPGTPKGVGVDIARAVGTREGQAWSPFSLETIDEPEEGGPVLLTDCPNVTLAMPLLSRRAREVLEPLFGDRVEHLPTVSLAGDYTLLNCLVHLPAIDTDRSEGARMAHNGKFMTAHRMAFHPDVVRDQPVFTAVHAPTWVFLDGRVADAIARHDLIGFRLTELWSEAGRPVTVRDTQWFATPAEMAELKKATRLKREAFLARGVSSARSNGRRNSDDPLVLAAER